MTSGRQYYLDHLKVWLTVFGKFFFIGAVTTVLAFTLTWLLRLIPGVKKVI